MSELSWLLWLAHLVATSAMCGIIWMVQWVQYPLFAKVGRSSFADYHAGHVSQITFVVLPFMALELGTAIALTWLNSGPTSSMLWYLSLVSLSVIWLSTMFWQVPNHNKLASGFCEEAHRDLVKGNWLRTILWSLRTAVLFYLSVGLMNPG